MTDYPEFSPNRDLPFMFGDIFQIRSELSHYELKGIEKVINIMAGQYAQNKSVTEETVESESFSEFENEVLNELTKTESSTESVEQATVDVLSKSKSFGVSADVTLTYGVVRANAAFGMDSQSSQTQSKQEAQKFARTVTEQAREMVRNRSLRRHSSRSSLRELEETIRGIDNRGGGAAAMVYRYVEEVHRFDLVRHAKHLFTKFIMPDPAANYHVAMAAGASARAMTTEAVDVLSYIDTFGGTTKRKTLTPESITPDNWHRLASIFGLYDPTPPPEMKSAMAIVVTGTPASAPTSFVETTEVAVPEGYVPLSVSFAFEVSIWDGSEQEMGNATWGLTALVGGRHLALHWWGGTTDDYGPFDLTGLPLVDGMLPIGVIGHSYNYGEISIEVKLAPTQEAFATWQLEYFQQLVDARRQASGAGPTTADALDLVEVADLSGSPTAAKAMIDKEIHLLCLRYVLGSDLNGLDTVDRDVKFPNYPIIDRAATNDLQVALDFLNNVFDFSKMTYQFLPPYLGGREHRMAAFQNSPTGLLGEFVRAGAVEILLPVRQSYEEALLYFLQTGLILKGTDIPLPSERHMIELYEEIVEARALETATEPVLVNSWFQNFPTEHVLLQEGAEMPDWRDGGVLPGGVTNSVVAPSAQPVPDVN